MKMLGAKKGFTLVEMLIVISIVGLLATISIGGYTRFRKASVLDLSADSIVATIYDARDSAKFGKVMGGEVEAGGEITDPDNLDIVSSSKCFGVRFTVGDSSGNDASGNSSGISKFTTTFDTKKQWSSEKGRWIAGGCLKPEEDSLMPMSLGELLKVERIGEGEGGSDFCEVLFSPPNGELFTTTCTDVVIGYEDSDDDLKRKITIDSNTGKVTITKIGNEEVVQ